MAEMDEDDRRQAVAEALDPVLEEGDEFHVRCRDGVIVVSEASAAVCREQHPKLYGRLLSLNAELIQAGRGLVFVPLMVTAFFCLGLDLGWWNTAAQSWGVPDLPAHLRSAWFYLLLFVLVLVLVRRVAERRERAVYREERAELAGLIASEGLDTDRLLALIEGDEAVARIGAQLKLERRTYRRRE
jgi:hypothetical protein